MSTLLQLLRTLRRRNLRIGRDASRASTSRSSRLILRLRPESGDATIIAVLAVILLTLIPISVFSASLSQIPVAQSDVNYQRALSAAEAGVQDYLNRLDAAAISGATPYYDQSDPSNPALTGWAAVAESSGEYYHYSVDASNATLSGTITLTSIGAVVQGSISDERAVSVQLRQNQFLNNLATINYMTIDPSMVTALNAIGAGLSTSQATSCSLRWDQGMYSKWQSCSSYLNYYITGSVENGPIESNDVFYLNGTPKFTGPAYSSNTVPSSSGGTGRSWSTLPSPNWLDPSCSGGICSGDNPSFYNNTPPQMPAQPITFPSTNATSKLTGDAQSIGCYYVGPTYITLNATTYSVNSPYSTSSTTKAACLTSSVSIATHPLIYVANQTSCNGSTQFTINGFTEQTSSSCSSGDAYIQGDLTGGLSVIGGHDIYIVGNLLYSGCAASGTKDVLGLDANNNIFVANNFAQTNGTRDTACKVENAALGKTVMPSFPNDVVIYAAMLAIQNSFDTYSLPRVSGSAYSVYVTGAIAENYMDTEGEFQGSQLIYGYNQVQNYDSRLAYLAPPDFQTPVNATWQQVGFGERAPTAGCSYPSVC